MNKSLPHWRAAFSPELRQRIDRTVLRDVTTITGPEPQASAAFILLLSEKIERLERELNPEY